MYIWDSLAGQVKCRVVSASLKGFFSEVTCTCGISDLQTEDDLTAMFRIGRNDFPFVQRIAQKRGDTLEILQKHGLFWPLQGLIKRPVLVLGLLIFALLILFLPTRVLFVGVEGNSLVTDAQILEAAASCGVRFGASREQVRSERIKNALLQSLPQLQWACINTSGCVAVISVQERNPINPENMLGISHIIAAQDGIITDMTVYNGTALCKVGQGVRKGETLISGYTDLGLVVKAGRAEGEIYAQTRRGLLLITPTEYQNRELVTRTENKYSLLVGKKLINFAKDSGISPAGCGRMYVESYATLPGGFRLPFALVLEQITYYEETAAQDQESAYAWLEAAGKSLIQESMIAGEILSSSTSVQPEDGIAVLRGTYHCREMIGCIRNEEIFANYGKRN